MNVIDLEKILKEKQLPRPLKLLKEMDPADANEIVGFILGVIVAETRFWLGLEDGDLEEPVFYDKIEAVYKEYWGKCYFCNPHAELDDDSELCIVCHKKLIDFMNQSMDRQGEILS